MSMHSLSKFSRIGLFFAVLCLLVYARPASADSVTWTLSGVTFTGGGTASGSFVFNAVTDTFSSINITVSGAAFGDGTYTTLDPGFASSASLLVTVPGIVLDFNGTPVLAFTFVSGLTDAGGTVALGTDHGIQVCDNATCSSSHLDINVATGSVTTAPEPSSLLLLGAGLLGAALFLRRLS